MSTPLNFGPGGIDDDSIIGKPPPTARFLNWLHARASLNRPEDLHHRLGFGPYDAAPGNHTHDGVDSPAIPGLSPEDVAAIQDDITEVNEALEDMRTPPACTVIRGSSAALALASGAYTLITGANVWSTTQIGALAPRGGMTFDGTSIVVPVDGIYRVDLGCSLASTASGTIFVVKKNNLALNSTDKVLWTTQPGNIGSTSWGSASADLVLEAGDSLAVLIYTQAGGVSTLDPFASGASYFSARLVEDLTP